MSRRSAGPDCLPIADKTAEKQVRIMQRTIRVLRAIALAGAGVMCWLVSGAAQPEPGQAEAGVAQRLGVSHFVIEDLVVDAAEPAKQVAARVVIDGRERRLVMMARVTPLSFNILMPWPSWTLNRFSSSSESA